MKEREYTEGPKALENFEEGMKAIFKVPKVTQEKRKKKATPSPSLRKPKNADKD